MFTSLVTATIRWSLCVVSVKPSNLSFLQVHLVSLLSWTLGGWAHNSWFEMGCFCHPHFSFAPSCFHQKHCQHYSWTSSPLHRPRQQWPLQHPWPHAALQYSFERRRCEAILAGFGTCVAYSQRFMPQLWFRPRLRCPFSAACLAKTVPTPAILRTAGFYR